MSRRTTVTSNRLRRFATILLGTVALIFVTTAASNAVAQSQCFATGRSCGGNSASNDVRCCAGLVCGATSCCTAACRINNTLYSSGATNPQNPCQSCQPSASTTSWTNKSPGATCNDNNACTTQDKCQAGTCSGTALSCDDHNSCTQDTCDPARGCVRQNLTGACEDGNACTLGDTCSYGTCRAGTGRLTCNDNNACTNDTCNPSQGCVYTNNTNSCSDGNTCTTGDKCSGGTCRPTGTLSCNDSNGCTDDWCDPTLGCKHSNNTSSCSDGNPCTAGDTCGGGSCRPGGPNSCDDNNPCTNDTCDRYYSGGCKHTNNTNSCDDGNACTSGDKCSYGVCKPGTGHPTCNDNNACTNDSCDPTLGCVYAPNTNSCSDYNACTEGDQCRDGRCQGELKRCDDYNPCTDDTCDPAAGCRHANNSASCSDDNACTAGDHCSLGGCVAGAIVDCDDHNPCTADSCNPSTRCVHSPADSGTPCSDNDACTGADHCSGGECLPGEPVLCDDHNQCTADSCDPSTGCVHSPVDSGTPCSDNDACTGADHCSGGECLPGEPVLCDDHNQCTADSCNPSTGCVHTPADSGTPCSDNDACTGADHCSGDECLPGDPVLCDDHNPCTFDSCDPSTGCVYSPVEFGTLCNGGNVCTGFNYCSDGECVPAHPVPCDDNNPCTTDTCIPPDGCVYTANSDSCSDGDPCTAGDECSGGLCVSTDSTNCDDGSDCTEDSCNPATGCKHTPIECMFCSKSASVVVFDNPIYVTTSSANVQASLTTLGHPPTTFTGIDAASINEALAGKQVLLIPEQNPQPFDDELAHVLTGPAIAAFQNFVSGGGGLIIHSTQGDLDQSFLSVVFGIYVAGGGEFGGSWFLNPNPPSPPPPDLPPIPFGTAFCGGPTELFANDHTQVESSSSIQGFGGKSIYVDPLQYPPDHSVVTLLPYGAGEIVVLGWDWDDAAAILAADDSWQQVLDRAVNQVAKLTTFTANPGLAIPDDGYAGGFDVAGQQACSAIDTTSLPAGITVHHVDVDIDITHTWVGDLVIKLRSPDGSILGILSRPGSVEPTDDGVGGPVGEDSNWGVSLKFSDTGPDGAEQMGQTPVNLADTDTVCTDGGTPCHYTPAPGSIVNPPTTFADFNGENARGTWTLCVGDAQGADTGTLHSWSLTVH